MLDCSCHASSGIFIHWLVERQRGYAIRRRWSLDKLALGLDISIQKQLKCILQGFPFFLWKTILFPYFFSRLNRKPALSFVPLLILIIQDLGTWLYPFDNYLKQTWKLPCHVSVTGNWELETRSWFLEAKHEKLISVREQDELMSETAYLIESSIALLDLEEAAVFN